MYEDCSPVHRKFRETYTGIKRLALYGSVPIARDHLLKLYGHRFNEQFPIDTKTNAQRSKYPFIAHSRSDSPKSGSSNIIDSRVFTNSGCVCD